MLVSLVACDRWCIIDIRAYRVENLGILPYWLGSIIYNTAQLTCVETTKSSASLEMVGVSEIGHKCFLRSSTGFYFGRVTTSASFHEVGFVLWGWHSVWKCWAALESLHILSGANFQCSSLVWPPCVESVWLEQIELPFQVMSPPCWWWLHAIARSVPWAPRTQHW